MDLEVGLREFVSVRGRALSRATYLPTGDYRKAGASMMRRACHDIEAS